MIGAALGWVGLLCKLLAEALAIMLARRPFHTVVFSLITAHDAVRPRKVGDTEMKEDSEVISLVTKSETKVGVVKLVANV